MIHDHAAFAAAHAYCDDISDRVRRFIPLVKRLAWHVHGGGRSGIELEDLIQIGLVALTECAQRHNGPGEDGFAAYAKLRVRGAMIDHVRKTIPLSRGASRRRAESADEPGLRFEPIDDAYSDRDPAFASDMPDGFEVLSENESREALIAAIAALPQRLQLVVQLYFVEELNLAEIAAALDVSAPRVHQLKAQALAQLRTALGERLELV